MLPVDADALAIHNMPEVLETSTRSCRRYSNRAHLVLPSTSLTVSLTEQHSVLRAAVQKQLLTSLPMVMANFAEPSAYDDAYQGYS